MKITKPNTDFTTGDIELTSSKSESNRALIIQALCTEKITIDNLSESDDTQTLKRLLLLYKKQPILDVGHAGTTFRFLTAFLAIQQGEWTLTGSDRMKERPIWILSETLNKHGATINYLDKKGFPPLQITGSNLDLSKVYIDGSVSSQYISALILIAPFYNKNVKFIFKNKVTSRSYIDMTISIMQHFGIKITQKENEINIEKSTYKNGSISIESDWSAASYWYQIAALSNNAKIKIPGLKKGSFQGDSKIVEIYKSFGVSTVFEQDSIIISKEKETPLNTLTLELNDNPDLAQTIICTCAGLGIETTLSGLETLQIKETNRLTALKNELMKFGVEVEIIGNNTLYMKGNQSLKTPIKNIETYNDHRMAMAFAPLALKIDQLEINNPEVVSKSYPNYWNDLNKTGFKTTL